MHRNAISDPHLHEAAVLGHRLRSLLCTLLLSCAELSMQIREPSGVSPGPLALQARRGQSLGPQTSPEAKAKGKCKDQSAQKARKERAKSAKSARARERERLYRHFESFLATGRRHLREGSRNLSRVTFPASSSLRASLTLVTDFRV